MVDEEILQNMDIAREALLNTNSSIVIVQYGKIWKEKKGEGIKPILETIEEMKDDLNGAVVGDKILGKASALLCAYANVGGVFALKATKTAIAVLIRAGIPGQTETLVETIENKKRDGMCPFEKMLSNIDSPEEAYTILKKAVKK